VARIRAFRGWRYAVEDTDISHLVSPPYDVISPEHREYLSSLDSHNVVELELPEGDTDPSALQNRYANAAEMWREWRTSGVLAEDDSPAIYLLEQRYELDGRQVRRRAFLCELAIEPFDNGVVLAHERTLPKALGDRFELLKATNANFSPIFGLFSDPADTLGAIFDALPAENPATVATDEDIVETRMWVVSDPATIAALVDAVAPERVFIADGHHRYTTALAYRDLRRSQAEVTGERPHDKDYDFVLMALVNMEDPELVVLPYHRIAKAAGTFSADALLASLTQRFDFTAVAGVEALEAEIARSSTPGFGLYLPSTGAFYAAALRPGVDLASAIPLKQSDEWKRLDTAVLQELVLDDLLDIHPDRPDTLQRLTFAKGTDAALELGRDYDAVFIMRPTSLEELREVALNDETMPQKSTYFYPKLPAGFVLRGMSD
jgi:uncharacterized protein (DUF1015 family)